MQDIVYVDDELTGFMALVPAQQKNRICDVIYDPADQNIDIPACASTAPVWLFDFFLVTGPSGGLRENGLSLFQKWREKVGGRPITVVLSSDLETAVGKSIGRVERHHIIAQKLGVEWIGDKTLDTVGRVMQLADAAATVESALSPLEPDPREPKLGTYESDRLCFDVFGVPREAEWADNARKQIDRARPPREVPTPLGPATARSIVGWLLAYVLPYPSFLLTDAQAALRLGVSPESFQALSSRVAETKEGDLGVKLLSCRYTGPLADFLGPRWWRAAIDDLAWCLSQEPRGMRHALEMLGGGTPLEWLEQSEPVLLSDADLVETERVAEARECVRVTDEDFPANVDPAWVAIIEAQRDRTLAARVIFEDRDLLSADNGD